MRLGLCEISWLLGPQKYFGIGSIEKNLLVRYNFALRLGLSKHFSCPDPFCHAILGPSAQISHLDPFCYAVLGPSAQISYPDPFCYAVLGPSAQISHPDPFYMLHWVPGHEKFTKTQKKENVGPQHMKNSPRPKKSRTCFKTKI